MTMTRVILMVLILALGMTPLELAWHSVRWPLYPLRLLANDTVPDGEE